MSQHQMNLPLRMLLGAMGFFLPLLEPAASVSAQEPKFTSPAPVKTAVEENTYGTISGRVLSEDGPLPFVPVTLVPVGGPRDRGNSFRSLITDAEGNFKAEGLRSHAWNIFVSAQGYVTETATEESGPTYFRIGETATIRLLKGGVISGRVVNAAGEPVIAVPVSAQLVRNAQGKPATGGTGVGNFQTDDRGIYRIYGLAPGNYIVSAGRSSGFGPGNRLSPYEGDVPTYYPSATRDTAVEVSVSSGGETGSIDIRYRGGKGHAISGKIAGSVAATNNSFGFGGAGIAVTLTQTASGTPFSRTFVATRDGNNAYAVHGVPDGEYEITAERNSPGNNDAVSAPRRVQVSGRDVTGVDLTLLPMASLAARVVLENENKDQVCEIKRKPSLSEQVFELTSENNDSRQNSGRPFQGNRRVSPERTGEMMFSRLSPGRYFLEPRWLDENWYLRSVTLPGAPVKTAAKTPGKTTLLDLARQGLTLKSGDQITGVTVKVSEGAARLSGKIVPAPGTALAPSLYLYLFPAEKERADEVLRHAVVAVEPDGGFKATNLAPGKYLLLTAVEPEDARKKVVNAAERAKLRHEAELGNRSIELQACQVVTNYEFQLRK